jgi:hypothetical protein
MNTMIDFAIVAFWAVILGWSFQHCGCNCG